MYSYDMINQISQPTWHYHATIHAEEVAFWYLDN